MKESKRPLIPGKKAEHLATMTAALLVLFGGLLAAAAFYFLLPFSLEVRQALALLAVSPVSSAVPGFTRDLGEDTGLSSAINSVCIVVSIVLMVTMLSVI